MFFAVSLPDFDFAAAEMKVFVFGVADRPAASVVVQVGEHGFMFAFGMFDMNGISNGFNPFPQSFRIRLCRGFRCGSNGFVLFFFRRGFGFGGFGGRNFGGIFAAVFFLDRRRTGRELQTVNLSDDGVFGNVQAFSYFTGS